MTNETLPRVLRRALGLVRFAREQVGADATSLFLVRERDDDGVLHGLVTEWDWTRTSFALRTSDYPSVREALESGRPQRIRIRDAQGAESGWFETHGIDTTVCVPLCYKRRTIGVLFFDYLSNVTLNGDGMALLADVGRRCVRAFVRPSPASDPAEMLWTR